MNDDVSWGEIFSPEELATLPPVHSDPVLNVSVRGTSGFLVARAQKFTSWKDLRRFVHLGEVGGNKVHAILHRAWTDERGAHMASLIVTTRANARLLGLPKVREDEEEYPWQP